MAQKETKIDCWMTEVPEEKFSAKKQKPNDNRQPSTDMWQEFADSTTLHGLHYVSMKRHFLVRIIWLILLLASGSYYIFTVYRAFNKYYQHPVNTVLSRTYPDEMDFPAVTICPLNLFAKSKLFMKDANPLFASSGLNITSCAVTSKLRSDRPCGLSMLCCCSPPEFSFLSYGDPNCTSQYQQAILEEMQRSLHHPDVESFFRYYAQDITALVGPMCTFGWQELPCSAKDFLPIISSWGMCYTFNSGTNEKVKTVDSGGVSSGLSVVLDTQTPEYYQGKYSEGFKVLIHGQGEYINEWEGINVGPGQHAVIALTQKRVRYDIEGLLDSLRHWVKIS